MMDTKNQKPTPNDHLQDETHNDNKPLAITTKIPTNDLHDVAISELVKLLRLFKFKSKPQFRAEDKRKMVDERERRIEEEREEGEERARA
ncbi:hypothetical protein RJT34_24530 [Clitoria ternatea]|uniref:Uncharacterized protein n=1 Tax=Clitoria ternatea TaxID=43366 RepID=A0AAN9FN19_CLITE